MDAVHSFVAAILNFVADILHFCSSYIILSNIFLYIKSKVHIFLLSYNSFCQKKTMNV